MNRDGYRRADSSESSLSLSPQQDKVDSAISSHYNGVEEKTDGFGSDTSTLQDNKTGLIDNSEQALKSISYLPDATQAVPATDAQESISATILSTKSSPDIPVTWLTLPHKTQLAVLTIARLSEPLSERSLAAYMFYQLRWFDPSLPDSVIASQGGMLTAAFAAAQFLTAMWWGRAADVPWIGRKRVLLVGLLGTAIASIGVGFSKSFAQAICFRALAGALNGNIGVMRTMVSEIIVEKKFQSRAFLLLPMCFNVGVIIGPLLGGLLADPITNFPDTFGAGGTLGGKDGIEWMKRFPYALPNLFSGVFIGISALFVVLGLDETHETRRNKPDYGRRFGKWIVRKLFRSKMDRGQYSMLQSEDHEDESTIHDEEGGTELIETSQRQSKSQTLDNNFSSPNTKHSAPTKSTNNSTSKPRTGLSLILHTPNVLLTLLTHHLLALHVSSFNALIFLLLPAPRSHSSNALQGGLGLPQSQVALSLTILGLIGLPLQLALYPPLNARLGTLKSYRAFLPCSVVAYSAMPLLVLIPQQSTLALWIGMIMVLGLQVLSRTFALTGTVILVNNSSPGRHVLGSVHGVAQSVSSAARCLGPTIGGWVLGWGLRSVNGDGDGGNVGVVWWGMAVIAAVNWMLLWLIFEGDGSGGRA